MNASADDASRLQRIVGDFAAGQIACEDARSAVIDVVFDRLDVDRVSLWRFDHPERPDPAAQGLELRCFASKLRGRNLDPEDEGLQQREYRDYFNELIERGTFASDDAHADPALQPMRERYLARHGIGSLLDAAFMLNGRAYGMVCCEAIARRVRWRPLDVQALRAIVTRLAVLLAGTHVPELWNNPSLPLRELPVAS